MYILKVTRRMQGIFRFLTICTSFVQHKEDKKGLNLYELLEAYTTCETLSNDDLYYCSSCKTLRQVSETIPSLY